MGWGDGEKGFAGGLGEGGSGKVKILKVQKKILNFGCLLCDMSLGYYWNEIWEINIKDDEMSKVNIWCFEILKGITGKLKI